MPVDLSISNSIIQSFLAGQEFARQRKLDEEKKVKEAQERQDRLDAAAEARKQHEELFAENKRQHDLAYKAATASAELEHARSAQAIYEGIAKGIPAPGYKEGKVTIDPTKGTTTDYIPENPQSTLPPIRNVPDPTSFAHQQAALEEITQQPKVDAQVRVKQAEDAANLVKQKELFNQQTIENEKNRKNQRDIARIKIGAGQGDLTSPASVEAFQLDKEAILEGRNTMYNIRQTMGRSNQSAEYMKKLRTAIAKEDPKFDFVASDAGGKSASQTFVQRGLAAIDSVLPNLDKLTELSNQVQRDGLKFVNNLMEKKNVQFGDKKVTNFLEAQKLVADEIGLALGVGALSDMKLQLGFDITDPAVTPEIFASNIDLIKDFIINRRKGLTNLRYKSGDFPNETPEERKKRLAKIMGQ